jgi:predicted phage terminase large subunit-like protein
MRESYDENINRWIDYLAGLKTRGLPEDIESFLFGVLSYQVMPFHKKWWEFTRKNPVSLLLAPRGHGKSTVLTVGFLLFSILKDMDIRTLITSNTAAQAQAFLREIKHHLENNPKIIDQFGHQKGHPWNESEITVAGRTHGAKEPTVTAIGVGGPVISRHYDLIVLDDVVDEDAARSKNMRQRTHSWYYKELLPTLEPDGELHILGTRYHYDDLYGKLLSAGIPSLVEQAVIKEETGERALWEEKFSLELLKKKREEAGPAIFNTQYQNDISLMEGKIFRPEWISYSAPKDFIRKYQGIDLAIGTADHNDYFAHVTVGEAADGTLQVTGAYKNRLSFEEQFRAVVSLFSRHNTRNSPVTIVGIESNAYQAAMVQRVLTTTSLPVKSIHQTKDKVTRAMRLQGKVQAGLLTFPESGMSDLIEEMLAFPDGEHDDLVDALEMAVRMSDSISRYTELPVRNINVNPG